MKPQQFKNLIGAFAAVAVMLWLGACATQTSNVADTSMEQALLAAHFKVKTATTVEQRNHLRGLPDNRFAVVKEGGETYYLYADKKDGRLYAGDHWAYQAFVNDKKNNRLRKEGAFVFETDPSNRADNRTVVIWHDWSPFQQWE
jgi:hypothetical protein